VKAAMKFDKNWGYLLLIILIFVSPIFISNQYYLHVLVICVINIILAASLRAMVVTGQMSLGHAGFMGIGAYTSAILAVKLGASPYIGLLLGGVAAMALAALIAYPMTRVKTVYFAMLTMFLGTVIQLVITQWRSLTGGTDGMINIPRLGAFLGVNFTSKLPNLYFALGLMMIILAFLYFLDRSYLGKTFKAIAQDDALAASVGINVAWYKALIFCLSCFIAGLVGGFYSHYMTVITPDSFNFLYSVYILIYMIVGGTKRFGGAIIGAFLLTLIPEMSRFLKEYQPFIFVAVLYLVVFFLPGGLADLPGQLKLHLAWLRHGKDESYVGN
jgi:branched-chain amino acid transport system permease protein